MTKKERQLRNRLYQRTYRTKNKEVLNKKRRCEKKVSYYITNNQVKIPFKTMSEIGIYLSCSATTVARRIRDKTEVNGFSIHKE